MMSWTPEVVELFNGLKKGMTSSPVLEIFDPNKPNLLNTDWRAEVMVWILMHPTDDEELQRAVKLLRETGE